MNVDKMLEVLGEDKVLIYDFIGYYRGFPVDIKSVNKQKKTAVIVTSAGELKIKLEELSAIVTFDQYMRE